MLCEVFIIIIIIIKCDKLYNVKLSELTWMHSFGDSFNRTDICSVIVDKIDVMSELIDVKLAYLRNLDYF